MIIKSSKRLIKSPRFRVFSRLPDNIGSWSVVFGLCPDLLLLFFIDKARDKDFKSSPLLVSQHS